MNASSIVSLVSWGARGPGARSAIPSSSASGSARARLAHPGWWARAGQWPLGWQRRLTAPTEGRSGIATRAPMIAP